MSLIKVTSEFGLVIRRQALTASGISMATLLEAMESEQPLDMNDDLISFGPSFGQEALDEFSQRLVKIGLNYFDDFFEFSGAFPSWCQFQIGITT